MSLQKDLRVLGANMANKRWKCSLRAVHSHALLCPLLSYLCLSSYLQLLSFSQLEGLQCPLLAWKSLPNAVHLELEPRSSAPLWEEFMLM